MTGAKVKQLDWHNFDAWTHWAEAVCGTYHVEERNGWWQIEVRVGGLVHIVAVTDDTLPADLEAAKAAAQADYETRILAALDPVAAPDPAAIREAALEIWKHANSRDPDDPVFIAAILALIPTKATADPAVNAPDYSLAPHLQRIVEGAKNAPQWDTVSDRMAATDPTEYERKVAQMKEDFPNGI